ncbi:hypothetical protein Tco_0642706 [Tanacetum coccineum]
MGVLQTSSKLAIVDPSGDITVPTTLPRKFLTQDFIGQLFTVMPMTWSPDVTLVQTQEKFRIVMKMPQNSIQVAKSFDVGADDFWGRSPSFHEREQIYTRAVDYLSKGLKRKRSPPMTPELFANFLNLSSS